MDSLSLHAAAATSPLAVRMRPRGIEEIVGQEHLLQPGSPLRVLATPEASTDANPVSVILWGPPGTGKTTVAQAVARSSGRKFVELSAISAGVKDVRETMERALSDRDLYGVSTLLFLDEIHRFSKSQQDALLPGVEQGWVTLIAATTENPSFSVISPLLSRSLLLTLQPLSDDHLRELITRAVGDSRGLAGKAALEPEALDVLVRFASGDARRALTALEAAFATAASRSPGEEPVLITADSVTESVQQAMLRYDKQGDQHYDVTSAFIKSVRGSDPDAALHYLARMLEAGEDARFIARRLIILAAEDIGLADPQALPLAVACAEAVQLIGLPEGRIPLAEATVYLATAPKSNAVYSAINEAIQDVRRGHSGEIPIHLRDASYGGAAQLGHGKGYVYPHDTELGVVAQQYSPDALRSQTYYRPSQRGSERAIGERLERLRGIVRGHSSE